MRISGAQRLLEKAVWKIKNQRNDFQPILGLSRGILAKQMDDTAIGNFFLKMKFKGEFAGKTVMEVPPAYTSQACSQCGNIVKKDLSVRIHHCLQCGLVLDRDHNAAKNILRLGAGNHNVPT